MVMSATTWMVMRGQARICEISVVLAVTWFRRASVHWSSAFRAVVCLGTRVACRCAESSQSAPLPRLGMMVARAAGPSRSGLAARAARAADAALLTARRSRAVRCRGQAGEPVGIGSETGAPEGLRRLSGETGPGELSGSEATWGVGGR